MHASSSVLKGAMKVGRSMLPEMVRCFLGLLREVGKKRVRGPASVKFSPLEAMSQKRFLDYGAVMFCPSPEFSSQQSKLAMSLMRESSWTPLSGTGT